MLDSILKEASVILCLNSTLPKDKNLYKEKLIIATDGAANRLYELGISADVIIGDFDSVDKSKHESSKFVHLPDQSQSDFQKAIQYINLHNLNPFVIFGINDGFLDHIICNISILAEQDCTFFAPPIIGHTLSRKRIHRFSTPIGTKISIMALPSASVSSQGLKWELKNAELSFPTNNSWFNRTKNKEFSLELESGKILIMLYLESIEDMGLICALEA